MRAERFELSLYSHWAREFAIPRFSALRAELQDECFELAGFSPT